MKLATGISVAQTTQLTVTLLVGVLIGLITAWQASGDNVFSNYMRPIQE